MIYFMEMDVIKNAIYYIEDIRIVVEDVSNET